MVRAAVDGESTASPIPIEVVVDGAEVWSRSLSHRIIYHRRSPDGIWWHARVEARLAGKQYDRSSDDCSAREGP
jgi:hypothetical protein